MGILPYEGLMGIYRQSGYGFRGFCPGILSYQGIDFITYSYVFGKCLRTGYGIGLNVLITGSKIGLFLSETGSWF